MQVIPTEIPDVKVFVPKRFKDSRGFFSETYNAESLRKLGINATFVQDNQSLSVEKGVVRGLHYQLPPMAQHKLVRVVRGAILDVALDIRRGSPTFGKHVTARISAEEWNQIFVPIGFAHGFVTLEPNTEVIYKVSDYYSPAHERGIRWNDPDLLIDWGIDEANAVLSERDRQHPVFRAVADLF
ncbi:MAG TPA: dTDP-4-dehydrorhamnose 3,5-epimerase [Tepidisphaeraceae bacterium]|nr:dTDP-4-dehydrorhamnose 3,5-epimerase [Tepidisphaeraceae bacterium]